MNDSTPPKPKRRWFQYSLRTLMVLLVVGAVVLGWVNVRMNRARTNRERVAVAQKAMEKAVKEIEKLGGWFMADYEERRTVTWLENLLDDPGGSDDRVTMFIDTTDAGLEHLKELTNLTIRLHVSSENITDAGLEHLKGLTNLEELDLVDTTVTDEGVDTKVTDAGIEKLRQALPNCRIGRSTIELHIN